MAFSFVDEFHIFPLEELSRIWYLWERGNKIILVHMKKNLLVQKNEDDFLYSTNFNSSFFLFLMLSNVIGSGGFSFIDEEYEDEEMP
jgi:hypothetical protein